MFRFLPRCEVAYLLEVCLAVFLFTPSSGAAEQAKSLELSRTARPWEFFCATAPRAGLFGNESGVVEAWVYPLKIFRDFHLRFHTGGRSLPAETLVRSVTVRPESSSILYSGDTFSIRETLFVPVNEPGAVISFEIETAHPLEIEATFRRDFQLEWPASLGGTYVGWDANLRAFHLGEEQRKFVALVGSPSATDIQEEYQTNYSAGDENSLRLGVTNGGQETKLIVIAASVNGRGEAEATYHHLAQDYRSLAKESADYYSSYLSRTTSVELPDAQLQHAYDWARVSVIQGLVTNPYLGTGLIAGYRTSGQSQRPGFAWFFGRDSLWTSLALNAEGDFAPTKTALEFLAKYQRDDGKIPHEISQGANFVDWFKGFPYPFASVDATPLYIIAADDYVTESGDVQFARDKWESLWRAYQFLRSTYDSQGLPQNFGFGHGWVEGGPLLPVKTELYQSGLGAQALADLSNLAHVVGKEDVSKQLAQEYETHRSLVNQLFWSSESGTFAFALDTTNQKVIEPSALATVPMWFGLLDEHNAEVMLNQLAGPEHESDWGMRIISSSSPRYDAGGYHYGSVWPLFTGWASVGEYRYHHALPGYLNLQANAQLALDGSLGHVTEVLSGDYYQPLSTSSPHQIWSAAMVISPLLRGLLGLQADAINRRIRFAPHVPSDWNMFAIKNVRLGDPSSADFSYRREPDSITLTITTKNSFELEFSPALSPLARVHAVEFNGHRVPYKLRANKSDQHAEVRLTVPAGIGTLRLHVSNDFGVNLYPSLPALGLRSQGLRVLSEAWSTSPSSMTMQVAGAAGSRYELGVRNPAQISSVDGAVLEKVDLQTGKLVIHLPSRGSEAYPHQKIVFHFAAESRAGNSKLRMP